MNITPEWLTGFVEGEGAFTFSVNNGHAVPQFSIRQHEDQKDIVLAIQSFLRAGSVYDCNARGRTQKSCYLRIARKDDLPDVVAHFKAYPFRGTQKQKVFALWCRLVDEYLSANSNDALLTQYAAELSLAQLRPRGFRKRLKV